MNRDDILCSLQQIPNLEIGEVNDMFCVTYDDDTGKFTQYNFNMTQDLLKSKIEISASAQKHLPMSAEKLAAYLLANVDKYAFLTLDSIYFVYDKSDYEQLAKKYNDDSVMKFWANKEQGVMWDLYNVCIVGLKNIIEKENFICQQGRNFQIKRRTIGVTIHELRHLMLDTTLILDKDEYPADLGDEVKVDEYAFDVTDSTVSEWLEVFN